MAFLLLYMLKLIIGLLPTIIFLTANSFESSDEIKFSVLTYNVAGLPDFVSGSNPEVNTKLISPLLNDYDIVLVQEDFYYHHDLISRIDHPHRSKPDCDFYSKKGVLEALIYSLGKREPKSLRCLSSFGDGLNRLSRFPFSNFIRKDWKDCNGIYDSDNDCLAPKGFSIAVHQLAPGKFVHVYNLHTDAGNKSKDTKARRGNIRQLINTINDYSNDTAVIVAGDINSLYSTEGDIIRELLSESKLKDVWIELKPDDQTPYYISGSSESFDKIFYRSSANIMLIPQGYAKEEEKFTKTNGQQLSDHNAVSAHFVAQFK